MAQGDGSQEVGEAACHGVYSRPSVDRGCSGCAQQQGQAEVHVPVHRRADTLSRGHSGVLAAGCNAWPCKMRCNKTEIQMHSVTFDNQDSTGGGRTNCSLCASWADIPERSDSSALHVLVHHVVLGDALMCGIAQARTSTGQLTCDALRTSLSQTNTMAYNARS